MRRRRNKAKLVALALTVGGLMPFNTGCEATSIMAIIQVVLPLVQNIIGSLSSSTQNSTAQTASPVGQTSTTASTAGATGSSSTTADPGDRPVSAPAGGAPSSGTPDAGAAGADSTQPAGFQGTP